MNTNGDNAGGVQSGGEQGGAATAVEAAMSPEEWAMLNLPGRGEGVDWPAVRRSWKPHALAAAMLVGMPFGFTPDDVRLLRGASSVMPGRYPAKLGNLADRIAALLPP